MFFLLASLALYIGTGQAQFPSPPGDLTCITSELDSSVRLSYKQTHLCETTPGVKSFSGYVHLPRNSLSELEFDFDINTYFLFFEARNDSKNAPLLIYLAGGPGESSAYSAMSGEGGPCYVNLDANSTTLNPWSFNNHANVLYIDQPVGAGFSYTSLVNGTHDALSGALTALSAYNGTVPPSNATFGQGTFTDPTPWSTTNTTVSSAQALWHFLEHWLTQFPEYKSQDKRISIWGNSAGGLWVPATGALLQKKIEASHPDSALHEWSLFNTGITNGLIDFGGAIPYYIDFAYNNTYGSFISEDVYRQAKEEYAKDGGCESLINQCHVAADKGDPLNRGTNETVNSLCIAATAACSDGFLIFQNNNNVSAFDIAVKTEPEIPGGDPCPFYFPVHTFLNQEWAQKELGVPLNFTYISNTVLSSFTLSSDLSTGTGAAARTNKRDLIYLLDHDVNVALIYGDRDSRCPWNAAEALLLTSNYTASRDFHEAGYEFIQTNDTYQGGVVRQVDNLSFSRIFQSGHADNTYQPQTVEQIFSRIIRERDIATGQKRTGSDYSTIGPPSSFYMVNETLPKAPGTCMVLGSFQNQSVILPLLQ